METRQFDKWLRLLGCLNQHHYFDLRSTIERRNVEVPSCTETLWHRTIFMLITGLAEKALEFRREWIRKRQ